MRNLRESAMCLSNRFIMSDIGTELDFDLYCD